MIIPAGPKILVRPFKLEENDRLIASARKAGIALPEFSERKEQINIDKGVVLALGPKVSSEYVDGVEVGDTIGFVKFGGKYVTDPTGDPDEIYLILNDEDVICVFKDKQ